MDKGKKWAVAFTVLNIILVAVCIVFFCGQDRNKPVISFGENDIIYSESIDQSRLLNAVYATDKEDGDLSERVVIEKIVPDKEKSQIVVFYAVTDLSGNVAKASRVFRAVFEEENNEIGMAGYVDVFENAPETTPSPLESPSPTPEMSSSPTPEATPTPAPKATATPAPTPKATATPSRTEENIPKREQSAEHPQEPAAEQNEEQPQEPTGEQPPVLVLNTSEVTVKAGEGPAWVSLIKTLSDDKDSYETLFRNLSVSKYDGNSPGSYRVNVTTKDSNDNVSAPCSLTIHVK